MIRATWYTRYGHEGASARYRAFQFFSPLRRLGVESRARPLGPPLGYGASRIEQVVPLMNRVVDSVSVTHAASERIVVQKEFFPIRAGGIGGAVTAAFFRKTRPIWDLDDAIWARGESHSRLAERHLMESGTFVAGNAYLAEWGVSHGHGNVVVIPTCVDVPPYSAQPRGEVLHIGWIGSPSTSRYLSALVKGLKNAASRPGIKIRFSVMGGRMPDELAGEPWARELPWTVRGERMLLAEMDLGVAPLSQGELEEGKCGFKVLQYMAASRPVIAGYTRATADIMGPHGLFATTEEEWVEQLAAVCGPQFDYITLGRALHQRALKKYSVSVGARLWRQVLVKADD